MPILLRVLPVADLAPGECRRVKVRGRKLFACLDGGTVGLFGTRCPHSGADQTERCEHYRTQVRGGFVYVALDPVANAAPADVHENDRAPQTTS